MLKFAQKVEEAEKLVNIDPKKALEILLESYNEIKETLMLIRQVGQPISRIIGFMDVYDGFIEKAEKTNMPKEQFQGLIRTDIVHFLKKDVTEALPLFEKLVQEIKKIEK